MLPFFPKIYPDELLYSVISRYHRYSGNLFTRDTMQDLFDSRTRGISIGVPVGLAELNRKVGNTEITFDDLLFSHTLFPFYALFSRSDVLNTQYEKIKNGEKIAWGSFLGIEHGASRSTYLRYCPQCRTYEKQKYGESYWHRTHQIAEMAVCPIHEIKLQYSCVKAKISYPPKLISLDSSNAVKEVIFTPKETVNVNPMQKRLQNDIIYCMNHYQYVRTIFEKYQCCFAPIYLNLMKKRGLATENEMVRSDFLDTFIQFFGNDFLRLVQLSFETTKRPWILSICRRNKLTFHTVKHILMAEFLVGSMESFVDIADKNFSEVSLSRPRVDYAQTVDPEKRDLYRSRWLKARAEAPADTIQTIKEMDNAAIIWLRRHDREWLNANSPAPLKRGGNISTANWTARDQSLSCKVVPAVTKLKSLPGKPCRITPYKIAEELGISHSRFSKIKRKLPLTCAKMEQEKDSTDSWRKRRIYWAIQEFVKQDQELIPWKIMRLAGIRDCEWKKYQSYVDVLISEFSRKEETSCLYG